MLGDVQPLQRERERECQRQRKRAGGGGGLAGGAGLAWCSLTGFSDTMRHAGHGTPRIISAQNWCKKFEKKRKHLLFLHQILGKVQHRLRAVVKHHVLVHRRAVLRSTERL